ncbi:MAG TPA: PAS domain S-box protein [Patescibacteria group bacterium]|nr:PAS domain S-box protein [Patescibacteria group bacterium]
MPPKKEDKKNPGPKSGKANDLFRTLFNSFEDAVFIHDLEGNFLEVNKTAYRRLGYKKEELLNMSPMKIDAPEYADKVKERIKELQKKDSTFFETEHVTKKGKHIPVELNSKVIDFRGQKAVLSVARDISKRKEKEQESRENEEKFRELFNNIKSGVVIYQPRNKGQYFVIKDMNRAAERLEEVKKDQVLNESVLQTFPRIKKTGLYGAIKNVHRTGNPQGFPVISRKNGEIKEWRENYVFRLATTGEVVNVYRDVTKERQEKKELKRTKNKMQTIVEFVPSAIFTVDEDNKILTWNQAAKRMTGFSKKEMIGQKCTKFSLLPCQNECGLWSQKVKKPIMGKECTIKTKKGEKRTVSKNVDYLRDARGGKIGGIESFIDITEKKKKEKELQEKIEEMEKINKLLTGRELKMIELKNEIKELKQKLSEKK